MAKISVIVPVYNVEKHLGRCIDSILNQTFADFELILVDDGSTDSSGKICDEYAKIDSRIVVIHKKNAGVSCARNEGIEKSKGEYVAFIDGDDYVSHNYLEKLFGKSEYLCICNMCDRYIYNGKDEIVAVKPGKEDVSSLKILEWYEEGLMYSACSKLFNLSIIKDSKLIFDTNTTRGEDTIFMFQYIELCPDVYFTSEAVYYYIHYGLGGSSSTKLNKKNVLALNYINSFIKEWLNLHAVSSKKFESKNYWTKYEQKDYFCQIYEDKELSFFERYKWYKLFYSLENFVDYLPVFFPPTNILNRLINFKSPFLLVMFQQLTRIMRMGNK